MKLASTQEKFEFNHNRESAHYIIPRITFIELQKLYRTFQSFCVIIIRLQVHGYTFSQLPGCGSRQIVITQVGMSLSLTQDKKKHDRKWNTRLPGSVNSFGDLCRHCCRSVTHHYFM